MFKGQVLTRQGWRQPTVNLTIAVMRDNRVQWETIKRHKEVAGNAIHFTNGRVEFMVTPTHALQVRKSKPDNAHVLTSAYHIEQALRASTSGMLRWYFTNTLHPLHTFTTDSLITHLIMLEYALQSGEAYPESLTLPYQRHLKLTRMFPVTVVDSELMAQPFDMSSHQAVHLATWLLSRMKRFNPESPACHTMFQSKEVAQLAQMAFFYTGMASQITDTPMGYKVIAYMRKSRPLLTPSSTVTHIDRTNGLHHIDLSHPLVSYHGKVMVL